MKTERRAKFWGILAVLVVVVLLVFKVKHDWNNNDFKMAALRRLRILVFLRGLRPFRMKMVRARISNYDLAY